MTTSRRTVVAMLGLAPASAVGAETFLNAPKPGQIQVGRDASNQTIASALRKLADSIVSGEVDTEALDLSTAVRPDSIVRHVLTVTFIHTP